MSIAEKLKLETIPALLKELYFLSRRELRISNMGHILCKSAAEHPNEYGDKIIEIIQNAPFILTREIGENMISRGTGKVISTASLLSFQGGINVP